jgi:hypothetical protein
MGMFGPKKGSWWVRCESDPRWDKDGRALVGGFLMPKALEEYIEKKTEELGTPPADCEWGYMKD